MISTSFPTSQPVKFVAARSGRRKIEMKILSPKVLVLLFLLATQFLGAASGARAASMRREAGDSVGKAPIFNGSQASSAGRARCPQLYRVRHRDTLSAIARRCGTSVSRIMRLNGLRNANLIYTGQRLRLYGKVQPPKPAPTPTPSSILLPLQTNGSRQNQSTPTATPAPTAQPPVNLPPYAHPTPIIR